MTVECRVGAPGIERRECERPRTGESAVPLLTIAIVLALVLVGGIAALNLPLREVLPAAGTGTTARVEAVQSDSPAAGPEYYVSRSRSGLTASDPVQATSLEAREVVAEVVEGDSPLAGPEYYVSRSRSGTAGTAVEAVKSDSPLAGPAYWVGRLREDAACTAWSDTLARFHAAKRVEDPVNGASSVGEAAFYVAQYGAGDVSLVTRAGNLEESVCGI